MKRDARIWVEGSVLAQQLTGIQRYVVGLVGAAAALAPELTPRGFIFRHDAPPRSAVATRWRTIPVSRLALFLADRARVAPPLEFLLATRPSTFLFPGGIAFRTTPRSRSVLIVYDLAYHDVPEYVDTGVAWLLRHGMPRSVARADVVVAISAFTRDRLEETFPSCVGKIRVIHGGVDERAFYEGPPARGLAVAGVDKPYFLFVSTLEPRKNLTTALEAYARLPSSLRARVPFVVVGGRGWRDDDLRARLDRSCHEHGVRVLGYVPDDDLPAVYAAARAFVFPSFYEGFGLPPLEAMAAGCPVIASNVTSLPEVVSDAGLLVDPRDVDAWASAMTTLAEDDRLREELVVRGRSRIRNFSWADGGRKLVDIFRDLELRRGARAPR